MRSTVPVIHVFLFVSSVLFAYPVDAQVKSRAVTKTPDAAGVTSAKAYESIRSDFARATPVMRTAIVEYYMNTQTLPTNNAQAALPLPRRYRGASLKTATVLRNGAIELVFDARSTVEGGRITLTPDLAEVDALGIQWRCETHDYPSITQVLSGCVYVPAAAQPASGREE